MNLLKTFAIEKEIDPKFIDLKIGPICLSLDGREVRPLLLKTTHNKSILIGKVYGKKWGT